MLPCRHPCHAWDLGLGTPYEVVSPNFQALNGWDCMNWPQLTWDSGLGIPCALALRVKCSISLAKLQKLERIFFKLSHSSFMNESS